jgi:hypothetical protein
VTFRPGVTFFADYDRFYRRGSRPTVEFEEHADQHQVAEPLKIAYLFAQKRSRPTDSGIPYVASKDVETAKFILARVPFEEVTDFIDYGLREAKKTRFDVQTLGGIKQYLAGYIAHRGEHAADRATGNKREAEEKTTRQRMEYSNARRLEADRLFVTLPAREKAAIDTAARGKSKNGIEKGSLGQIVFGIERARITAEKYPHKITSFEQWLERRAS